MNKFFAIIINFLLINNIFNEVEFLIQTIDNPGWLVRLDLSGTKFKDKEFSSFSYDNDKDWVVCRHIDTILEGFGDEKKLSRILGYISNSVGPLYNGETISVFNEIDTFDWLSNWYISWCKEKYDDFFQDHYNIKIIKEKNCDTWNFQISLEDTKLFGKKYNYISNDVLSSIDFVKCHSDGYTFYGEAGKFAINKLLNIFLNWTIKNGCN